MNFGDVFYFHAHFGFEAGKWEEHDEYGFVIAEDFNHAMNWITNYYREDLLSIEIEYVGDTGMVSIEDKKAAENFKRAYIKTHYGEEEK